MRLSKAKQQKYKELDAKPVGRLSKAELIKLEHEWRLKLKKSGFSDIEMWNNVPKQKRKKITFIKGHIRLSVYKSYSNFKQQAAETLEYYRVIGLCAHHAPAITPGYEKYRELLKDYAQSGYIARSIRDICPGTKTRAVELYIMRNFPKMLEFVRSLDRETDDDVSSSSISTRLSARNRRRLYI